jgi:UPF0042 nucleotide-binding protein
MNPTAPLSSSANVNPNTTSTLELILITGLSGSGKSVALRALEDAGYYCVDNLPPEMLTQFVELEKARAELKVAIAMDSRSASSLPLVPAQLEQLRTLGVDIRLLFLDTKTQTLVQRYSESRRRHPLSKFAASDNDPERDLVQAIQFEREILSPFREMAHIIDTSLLRSNQLQSFIKSLVFAPAAQLTLIFESFAFKRGIPVHADYVFDVRMLPNPYYEDGLRELTGKDKPVSDWLSTHSSVNQMCQHIQTFLNHWLVELNRDHRSYVTVALGCTGGQHRSVYLVERLGQLFGKNWVTLTRHRELENIQNALKSSP